MNSRTIRGSSDTIGLFPFLAVLLSTMGALLVLLVVLAQKAKQQAASQVIPQAHVLTQGLTTVDGATENEVHRLQQQLVQLHHDQKQLAILRDEAKARQRDEQLRLSHLEEHSRRLERELAKLHLASQQIWATEKKQVVDQEQAEHELVRLKELIEENRLEIDSLREQSVGNRSYAIIPYRGPQGTVRRPIYLECNKDGVTIQPEGIRLTAKDFLTRFDSGNPLAKALRAARDLLNTRAANAGESEPPDPYPLLVVRPDGVEQYLAARSAIKSWDADFGYEFIDQQWSLQYPESDPELAQVMRHAVMQGRERTAMLIQNAPRRYGRLGISTSLGHRRSGGHDPAGKFAERSSQDHGWGTGRSQAVPSPSGTDQMSASGNQANGFVESSTGTRDRYNRGAANGRFELAGPMGNSADGQGSGRAARNDAYSVALNHASTENWANNEDPIQSGSGDVPQSTNSRFTSPDRTGSDRAGSERTGSDRAGSARAGQLTVNRDRGAKSQPAGSSPSSNGGRPSGSAASRSGKGSSNGAPTAQASGAVQFSSGSSKSIASLRGSNWAIQGSQRGSVPIRRPIHVVIRKDQIAILRSRHTGKGLDYTGAVIPLNQPTEQVMDEFVRALREHMMDWGLAGNGLHWRPVLQLNIGPQGQQQAARLTRLLEGSGVEIDEPHTARQNQEVPAHATR